MVAEVKSKSDSPDVSTAEIYGYEDATPDVRGVGADRAFDRASILEVFESPHRIPRRCSAPHRTPRRSSLKQGVESTQRRRASIHMGEDIVVYLPGQSAPLRRRSSIKFDKVVKVKRVEGLGNMTDKPDELWFQSDEYKKIRRNSWDLVNKVERGQTGLGTRKYCLRGLEKMMDREAIQKKRIEAWDSVLAAQDMLHDRGHWDDELMAQAYRLSTFTDAKEAESRGREDEQAILSYQSSTRIYCRRLSC